MHFSRALSHFANRNRDEDINRAPRFSLAVRTVKYTMELNSYKKKDPERVRLLEERVGPLDSATKARRSVPLETFETQTDIRTSGASPPWRKQEEEQDGKRRRRAGGRVRTRNPIGTNWKCNDGARFRPGPRKNNESRNYRLVLPICRAGMLVIRSSPERSGNNGTRGVRNNTNNRALGWKYCLARNFLSWRARLKAGRGHTFRALPSATFSFIFQPRSVSEEDGRGRWPGGCATRCDPPDWQSSSVHCFCEESLMSSSPPLPRGREGTGVTGPFPEEIDASESNADETLLKPNPRPEATTLAPRIFFLEIGSFCDRHKKRDKNGNFYLIFKLWRGM